MNKDCDIFLMANLGSEVTRLLRAKSEHSAERMHGAYERACGIVKELEENTDANGRSESAILREVLDDLVCANPQFLIHGETLGNYFLPFVRKALNI